MLQIISRLALAPCRQEGHYAGLRASLFRLGYSLLGCHRMCPGQGSSDPFWHRQICDSSSSRSTTCPNWCWDWPTSLFIHIVYFNSLYTHGSSRGCSGTLVPCSPAWIPLLPKQRSTPIRFPRRTGQKKLVIHQSESAFFFFSVCIMTYVSRRPRPRRLGSTNH